MSAEQTQSKGQTPSVGSGTLVSPLFLMNIETPEKQQSDSDMIFLQITSGDFATLQEAESAIALFYVPDITISRAGISHALGRLKQHFGANIQRRDTPPKNHENHN